jgi:glycosyltransferase involved in cell wall biosynthesis
MPTEKAHGIQIMKTCEALANAGAEVELVVPDRRTPITEDPFVYYGVKNTFTLTRAWVPDFVSWGSIGFFISAILFSERAARQRSFWRADIVYSRDALILFQYILLGRPLVYEAHTAPTWVSTFVAQRARKVVTISQGLKDAYIERGISAEKIIVAHDAVDLDFSHAPSQAEARNRLGLPLDKKIALYVGKIDREKGAHILAAASELLQDIQVVLIGDGPELSGIKAAFPKVICLPATPYKDLPFVLPAADILVIPNSGLSPTFSTYTSPLKLFAYLASGVPIVASDVPAIREVVGDDAVRFFRPDDVQALVAALENTHQPRPTPRAHTWHERATGILKGLA